MTVFSFVTRRFYHKQRRTDVTSKRKITVPTKMMLPSDVRYRYEHGIFFIRKLMRHLKSDFKSIYMIRALSSGQAIQWV